MNSVKPNQLAVLAALGLSAHRYADLLRRSLLGSAAEEWVWRFIQT